MTRFDSLADAGAALVPLVRTAAAGLDDPCLVAIAPHGVPVAEAIAAELGLTVFAVAVDPEGQPPAVVDARVAGRAVIVVDDGVETGTAARAVGTLLRQDHPSRLLLAVPVCPREAQPMLESVYDAVVAIDRPLVRRDLRWHYRERPA